MYLLKCILLAGLTGGSVAFLDSLYLQLDSSCDGTKSFACRNSKCVESSKRCNGHNDCLDGSDEEDCDLFYCKPPNYFKCATTRKCIFHAFVCDDEDDCGDFSDERNCSDFKTTLSRASNCSKNEWQCADNLCIPQDFVCNGEKDCLDGSDETKGCTQDLPCDSFKCKNGHCIPNEWICDGNDDCHDNTDELNCQSHIKPQDCKLEKRLFLCANNLTCVNLTNVCDSTVHCPDKSDEGIQCSAAKNCANHQCSHECVQLPTGPKCLCPEGYLTIDDKTCKDINECEIYGICDQKCRNKPGSYECYCDEKYELQNDTKTCKVFGGEAMMIFSSNSEIRGYFLQSEVLFPIAKELKQVVGVAYDGHHIYWTDIFAEHESLVRSLEDGSEKELLVTSGLGAPEDLAVDWVTGNIYFTDSELQHIGVCTNTGSKCTVLVNQDINKPRGIVLHPLEGEMYWSDWGKKPEIAKSKMDGTQDISFVANNIRWPNGLAIDYPNERLYWTDAKLLTLESIRLDGTDRRVVLDGIVKHPYAIAIFENRLYWSDLGTHSIQSCDKFTGKDHHTLIKEKRQSIYGVHIYHSAVKPRTVNPCSSSFCSDICLISGPKSYTCACPQDKTLSSDAHTCKEEYKKQMLLVGVNNVLLKIEHQILGKHEIEGLPIVAKKIGALAYSTLNNTVYVSDIESRLIVSVNLNTGSSSPLHLENIGTINSMDFDYIGNNLYWTDSEKKTVEMLSLKTMSHKILLHDMGGEIPTSLALVPQEGLLFVAMSSENGVHIDRLRMDGTTRTHIVESGLLGPTFLHYDSGLNRIFWSDSGTGNIESTSADGDDRHGFRALRTTPTAITTLNKDLFWTNHNSRRLYWSRKDNSQDFNKKITLDLPDNIDLMHLESITPFSIPSHPCQVNNGGCSDICIPADKKAQCICPMGMGLKADNQTCVKRVQCTSDEFQCHTSNICIPKSMRCNNHKDCFNGEDEEDCIIEKHCPNSFFQCNNGECIKKKQVCDLHFDCSDKSDELDCEDKTKICPPHHHQCSTGFCLHDRFLCNGYKDCIDGSDELNCLSTTCASNQFRCLSGVCIPKNWECDLEYDCIDLSDEHAGCAKKNCNENQFKCTNGLCIDKKLQCNGLDDCGDNSDEKSCKSNDSYCRPNEFQCTSNKTICIPSTARCNGISDCPHHEDEQGCSDCHIDEFECVNKKCVPTFWICDGHDDCGDGSDENICSDGKAMIKNDITDMNIPCDHGFRCKSGACIDFSLVCNGEENCYDGSDEEGTCKTACVGVTNPCQHKCQATPSGPMCRCNEGYELAGDGHACRDIDECSQDPPICSQICYDRIGGYSCDCHDGFMIRSDKVSCKSIGESMTMLFTVDNEIRMLSQSDNSLALIHTGENPKITGLDVSTAELYTYFSIEEAESLHRINLKTKKLEFIKDAGKPQKLVVDWFTQNVYYVDADTLDKSIRVCNFEEQKCAKILSIDPHSQVSSLAIDSINKYLFYSLTTWWIFDNPSTVIYRANLDGTKVQEIVKNTAGSVTGITYDYNNKLLYYLDGYNGVINKLKYDGSEKFTIISNLTKPVGLSFFEDHLYYLTHFGYMGKCKLYGKERTCDTFRLSAYTADLFAISQSTKQPNGTNICKGHICSHLCVPSDVGVRCMCESGKVVPENTQCERNDRSSTNEGRGPRFGQQNMNEDNSSSAVLPILLILICASISGAIYYIMKKRNTGSFSVIFHNPTYGLRSSESAQVMLKPGEHEYSNPLNNTQSDFQAATNAILEKVKPLVRIDQ